MPTLPKRSVPFAGTVEGTIVTRDLTQPSNRDIIYKDCRFEGDFPPIVQFSRCRFDTCSFGFQGMTRFINTNFTGCEIIGCDFRDVELIGVLFQDCYFLRNKFDYTTAFQQTRFFRPRGLETNVNLHFVRNEADAQLDEDLANAPLPLIETIASWERLRTFGRLPLFGVSFSALVAIPVVIFLLGAYNEQVERLQEWASTHAEKLPTVASSLLEQFANRLHPIPIPNLTFWLLISTLFLGTASMLYALVCPARVKEFSLERWTDELNRPALHYLSLSWSHRWVRLVAGVCYLVGGFGTILILIMKLWNAGEFIIKNTALPWWEW
jgi:hypothetical protein